MRKCIYVDNLIEILNKEKVPFNADVNYFILNAPDADVQEVKHGIWVNIKTSISGDNSAECSLCGAVVHNNFSSAINYCPNCGAKMGLKEEQDEKTS